MRCRCDADVTSRGPKVTRLRGNPPRERTSRVIKHFRKADDAHFLHWEDQAWQLTGNKIGEATC